MATKASKKKAKGRKGEKTRKAKAKRPTATTERTPALASPEAAPPTAASTTAPATPKVPRGGTRVAKILELCSRPGGADPDKVIEELIGLGSTPEKARSYLSSITVGKLETAAKYPKGFYKLHRVEGKLHLIP